MQKPKLFGALAEFESTSAVFVACEKVRDAGFKRWDSHGPFPVHNIDKAMGLPASKLPFIVLAIGLAGALGGYYMQVWTSTIEYPWIISGKPHLSWPAFVPVTFELGVLFAAFAAVFGMLAINGLPRLYHSLFRSKRFERFSDDKFFISIESTDPKFDAEKTVAFLQGLGATHVELVED